MAMGLLVHNNMTFVLAPLDYRRSTETVKTIVENFQQSFGAGFQCLPKYTESSKDGEAKPNVRHEEQAGSVQKTFEAGAPVRRSLIFKRIRYYVARSGVAYC